MAGRVKQRFAGDEPIERGAEAGLLQQRELETEERRLDGAWVAELTQGGQQGIEGEGVRVERREGALDQVGEVEPGVVGAEVGADAGERFGEIPGGEGEELGVGLVDELEFAGGERFKPAGEGGAWAARAFGQAAEEAGVSGEERDRLAGLGPIPLAEADGLVEAEGHGR